MIKKKVIKRVFFIKWITIGTMWIAALNFTAEQKCMINKFMIWKICFNYRFLGFEPCFWHQQHAQLRMKRQKTLTVPD